MRASHLRLLAALGPLLVAAPAAAQVDTALLAPLRWRMIGPFRGGRTKASAGVPSRPGTFYAGVVNGGVWKTDDYGRTWSPIFDQAPNGSVGAIAVSPSNPDVIYVGSGEGLQRPDLAAGDGVYKSTDAGRTWTHLGLRDAQQIPQIVVDPRDPDRLFVAAMGHPYGPNAERGLFRSTDGGRTYQKVLYRDENTGVVDVVLDPRDPSTVYAVTWESRQAPWENGVFNGPGSGLWKSTDGGDHWTQLTSGLPNYVDDGLGRIGITVAPNDPRRLFATVESRRRGGLYRSDDAGATWTLVNSDPRVTERGSDFAEVKVDPTNHDVVYTASVVAWKSVDGGRTFAPLKGAPGGDDYHRFWIHPTAPDVMLLAGDQGAVITVNGGRTWSSWYNQPTAQMYHVSADNAFPYRVCSGQQESGSACVASRSNDGAITFRDWHPVGAEEYGYVVADPKNPDIVYGGKLSRYDRRTGQTQQISPCPVRAGDYCRAVRTMPVAFSPADSTTLYYATNVVWKTLDGGRSWTRISPDLTRRDSVVPPNVGSYAALPQARARHPGVVYALAPSPRSTSVLWAGTDDGLIQLTRDGGRTWTNVTPPQLVPWAKVSILDASHFDANVAYAAINTFRLDDLRPHILRTRDGGRTWTEIHDGIPDGGAVNVVREDPGRRGLLYAGTEQAVYVSFDDGDHWQSLRRDMPATSVRDLVIKDDDLVIGTHGRGFWIMDDMTPLRQIAPNGARPAATLLRPARATRVRWNTWPDTPLPIDEPQAENPPDGAPIDYWLPDDASRVSLEIVDAAGTVVRRVASDDAPEPLVEGRNIPDWWIRPSQPLPNGAGMHRWVWDLHETTPDAPRFEYPISAVLRNTPREPRGPWAMPGRYTVRLTVARGDSARVFTQPLDVRMDPRVATPSAALAARHALARRLADGMHRAAVARRAAGSAATRADSLARAADDLLALYEIVQGADVAPASQTAAAIDARLRALDVMLGRPTSGGAR
ncbi:glycosyl hydrolase BNR repeat-containing protein [Gemmatirosa kalamazoonensis]|uniref:Glycosyl hydrolase BNR repeat-containing protein n=1 Tax=Gemmatirosa kalamazoonensis TaxID=861299 RepID=W0RD36_9BACT|nr:glycoside hydrolase [Gemmatirosa kalamazoonensis]AHG89039.1 glycosyl hydrolase BNR repeat-containing protein [Gemmatirosa kalamazoonensis]